MTLDELLDRLACVRDPSGLSRLDRRKLEILSHGALDRRQIECIRRLSPDLVEGREPWIPGIGESFVLTASAAGGEVVRLRVERKGEPFTLETPGLGPDASRQVRLVLELLRRFAAARRRGVPELGTLGHVVTCSGALDGSSLGVSAAVAFVSSWLGRSPRAGVAATAKVDGTGALRAVAHVEAKSEALARERPGVQLLVATDQSFEGPSILRCGHLRDALLSFDLDLDGLRPARSNRTLRAQELQELSHAQSESYSTERWLDFVARALALADDPDCERDVRTMALGNGMLFALHAGDPEQAHELGAKVSDEDLECLGDAERAWVYVARASAAIDKGELEHAIGLAQTAVAMAERLVAMRDRREVVGRAHGTLGRALVHASRDEEALPSLERGAGHHREHLRDELPRSLCYLATNLRRLGCHDEAERVLDEALAENADRDDAASASTALYLLYERSRRRFECGAFDACLQDIEVIKRRQLSPTDYPRLGTVRYEVACRVLLGDPARAEELRVLAATSCEATPPGPLRRLAEAVAEVSLTDPLGSRERWDPAKLVY